MKFSVPASVSALAAALVLASLSSCGQRGPLYLPPPDPPPHSSAPVQPVQPPAQVTPPAPAPKPDDNKKDPNAITPANQN